MSSKHQCTEQDPSLRFRAWYIFVICTIAMLTIGGQITLQTIFNKSESWAYIINISGRQRMLSQKITKAVLAHNHEELRRSKEEWARVHAGLLGQNDSLKVTPENSSEILTLFEQLQPHFDGICASVDVILDPGSLPEHKENALRDIGSHEARFLPLMSEIVLGYNRQSDAYTASLKRLELIFGAVTLLTLLLEAIFIFEPLIKRFRISWLALRSERLRFDLAVRGSSDAIFDWDLQSGTLYLAPSFAEIVGVDPAALSGSPKDLLERICSQYLTRFDEEFNRTVRDPNYSMDIEIRIHHASGKEIWVSACAAEYRNEKGEAIRLVGSFADITKLKESQIMLRRLSERDSLTGLANRKSFIDQLALHMQRFRDGEQSDFGVLFLDFDRFKMINDSLGHDIGDGLLQSIAERMMRTLPEDAVISRFGGDEFAAILPGKNARDIEEQCDRLLGVLCEPHSVQSHEIRSTASIGLVLCDHRFMNADEMLCDADIAMYEAKNTGRGKIVNFDSAMLDQSVARQVLEGELIKASVTDQMHLVYQPIHDLNSGKIKGFESLIRWEHPARGLIAPDLFVKLAEECGAINHIGKWIFNRAVHDLQKIVDTDPTLTVNINVSRIQLLQPALLDYTREFAENHPELVRNVILEITETAFMDERVDIVPILEELHRIGYRMAIDDFGTGYSSLSCLHRFPIDMLKIDRSFIKSIEARREFTAVFAAIVSLANSLELDVVAEGVESKNQLIQLQAMDCGYCQGYLFSEPMTIDRAKLYITDQVDDDQEPMKHAA